MLLLGGTDPASPSDVLDDLKAGLGKTDERRRLRRDCCRCVSSRSLSWVERALPAPSAEVEAVVRGRSTTAAGASLDSGELECKGW